MIRILIFILWLIFIAGAVTYLLLETTGSRISGDAFGMRFDMPSWFVISAVTALFFLTIYLTHKTKDILAMPAKLRAKDAEAKRERGVAALTRGLEAVAIGDAADAMHHAKVAQRNLNDIALTRLLTAQAAHLSGDGAVARESFAAMLEAPETEFLGLKGLYAQAVAAGEIETAREYAERAFALRGNAGWAFSSVLDINLERGAWGDARAAIAKGKRNGLIPADKADRATAALLTASASASKASGNDEEALSEALQAIRIAPAFAPAATLAAKILMKKGKTAKAAGVLETAFTGEAHPALIRLYDKLFVGEPVDRRAEKLRRLAEKNPQSREAALLAARAANLIADYQTAMHALEPLIKAGPDAHAYALMATAMGGLHGDGVGRGWLERAAAAPRDPRPGADGEFTFNRAGWARLVREYMDYGRLAPPPLEDAGEALSAEELRQLTSPPDAAPAAPVVHATVVDDPLTDEMRDGAFAPDASRDVIDAEGGAATETDDDAGPTRGAY